MNSGFMPTMLGEPDPPRSPRTGRWVILAIVVLVAAGTFAAWFQNEPSAPTERVAVAGIDTLARAPKETRIRVRVLNTTNTRGLARRATFALRDLGYDVVDFDSESSNRATTLILSHTARTDWAERLQRAIGTSAMESRADTSRFVDFTVLIGRDWQPPPQAFRP